MIGEFTAYRIEGVELSNAEFHVHTRAAVATLAALVEWDDRESPKEEIAAEAVKYADALVIAYRMGMEVDADPIVRLSEDRQKVARFIWKEQGQKEGQIAVLEWMETRAEPARLSEIRKATDKPDSTILALVRRGLMEYVGARE